MKTAEELSMDFYPGSNQYPQQCAFEAGHHSRDSEMLQQYDYGFDHGKHSRDEEVRKLVEVLGETITDFEGGGFNQDYPATIAYYLSKAKEALKPYQK